MVTKRAAKAAKPTAKPASPVKSAKPGVVKVGPSKDIVRLSEELEKLMLDEQMRQRVPKGMAKCPACGAIIAPTRNKKVRTHDNPVGGRRCEASGQPMPPAKGR